MPFSAALISPEEAHVANSTVSSQPDLLPVPQNARTWTALHLAGYWIAEAFGASQYQVASTAVAAGLSPGTAIGAVFLGHVLPSRAQATHGSALHMESTFQVLATASWGYHGRTVAVICRAVAAIVWFGTQSYQGGQCVQVMLGAIWPSFKSFKNHLPSSAHVTSSELLCFFIFYIIQLPLLFIHISKLRHLFMLKVFIMPIFGFALFGWAVGKAHGFGPIFTQKTQVSSSSPVAVMFFSAMSSAIAPKATLALNICDFTRFAKSPRAAVWANILSLSIPVTLCAILGVVVTSATQVIYGVSTWNPLQVCELWGSRAAQFFAAFCWGLAVLATNISANSTAVGNDLTILFPRYINIRRGQYLCALVGLATCPWIIQNSAVSFTSFLGGYSIFLGPIAGILLTDYYVLTNRKLDVAALYEKESSPYWYSHGFNLRAIGAFILALIPNLPGFAVTVNSKVHVPVGARYVFSCVWPVGVVVAAVCYIAFNIVWPVRQLPERSETPSTTTDGDPEK
ncbi:NCS1 nucleoside transporter family [Mycena polygramma]|nr:NCS1 nucleoside transporter family [Mycena polygramma]